MHRIKEKEYKVYRYSYGTHEGECVESHRHQACSSEVKEQTANETFTHPVKSDSFRLAS